MMAAMRSIDLTTRSELESSLDQAEAANDEDEGGA
jgi:hypothetical protein